MKRAGIAPRPSRLVPVARPSWWRSSRTGRCRPSPPGWAGCSRASRVRASFQEVAAGAAALAVVVAQHRSRPAFAARPVVAGHVGGAGPGGVPAGRFGGGAVRPVAARRALGVRARQDVVHGSACRRRRSLPCPSRSGSWSLLSLLLSLCRSSTLEAISTPLTLYQGPLPIRSRAFTALARGRQIGVPGLAVGARRRGQGGAVGVRAREAAEVAALARAGAGDEEAGLEGSA